MSENKNLLTRMREICNEADSSSGNKLLYEFCKNTPEPPWGAPDVDVWASQTWLIGRSYAASPERRYTRKDKTKGGPIEVRGDGTGQFFYETAASVLNDKRYPELLEKLKTLQSPYCYDGGEKDARHLINAVETVALYNEMVKDASRAYDTKVNPEQVDNFNYRNQISFCSKFLHFHARQSVFIIDSFSSERAGWLLNGSRTKSVVIRDNGKNIPIEDEDRREIAATKIQPDTSVITSMKLSDSDTAESISKYLDHCVRSYRLGCYLKHKICPAVIPRAVDAIFLQIAKAE